MSDLYNDRDLEVCVESKMKFYVKEEKMFVRIGTAKRDSGERWGRENRSDDECEKCDIVCMCLLDVEK